MGTPGVSDHSAELSTGRLGSSNEQGILVRNVLLVTYSFPPVERSGARRPAALAKYLPRFGWRPVVLTPGVEGRPRNSEFVVETGYRDVLADWKARLNLDSRRGVHEQLGLSLSAEPGTNKAHTLAI